MGKKLVFMPVTEPLTEWQIEQAAVNSKADATTASPDGVSGVPWLSRDLEAVMSIEQAFPGDRTKVMVEGSPLPQVLSYYALYYLSPQVMIVLDSQQIVQGNRARIQANVYRQYPFCNIPIPSGQLFYYSPDAAFSGSSPKASWSMLIRDLVAARGTSQGEVPTGEPVPSQQRNWCNGSDKNSVECPSLACELQIRSPLPILKSSTGDVYPDQSHG